MTRFCFFPFISDDDMFLRTDDYHNEQCGKLKQEQVQQPFNKTV